jgi:hypothetical protein
MYKTIFYLGWAHDMLFLWNMLTWVGPMMYKTIFKLEFLFAPQHFFSPTDFPLLPPRYLGSECVI